LLNPETRTFGVFANYMLERSPGALPGAPLPFDQSLLLIWPQITGLIAGMIVIFAAAYVVFQREEVRA
jgi:ABC-2 type transport system permease protein